MNTERLVTLQLVSFGTVKETVEASASEAGQLLRKSMAKGWHYQIVPPDATGELRDDEQRYADDCTACGVSNCYAAD